MGQRSPFFFVSVCFCSVMAPTTRTPACRAISIACCTRPNSMFWSALLRERLLLLGDGADHAHAGLPGNLDRLLHAAELDVLVGLEKQDLVLRVGLVDRLEPLGQLVVGDLLRPRPQVEPEPAVLVDSELDLALPFRTVLGVRRARDRRLEARGDERRDDHENDQQHQHHVDQRRDVDVGLDGRPGASG